MKPQKKILITGAPGTGKTSIITALEKEGFYCFHEIIRTLTAAAKKATNKEHIASNPLAFVNDPVAFNQALLQGRKDQFTKATQRKEALLFFDRGLPDVLAYMDYFKQQYGPNFIQNCKANIYTQVFLLPPWKDIYIRDNERLESFEQAKEIDMHLKKTYSNLGYQPISVPIGTVAERVSFIKNKLQIVDRANRS